MPRPSRPPVRPAGPLVLIGLGLLLFAGAVGLGLRSRGAAPTAQPPAAQAEDAFPDIPRVSLTDALAAYENGSAVFVDVRDADSYASSHITGALSIPLAEIAGRLGELTREDWIITYCT